MLGHSNLTTTEVYVRADPTEKLEAIEAVVPREAPCAGCRYRRSAGALRLRRPILFDWQG